MHLLVSMGVAYILIDVNIHIPVSEIQDGNGGTHTEKWSRGREGNVQTSSAAL